MRRIFAGRSTFVTVIAAAALLVVAGGGGAVAGGLITSAKIKNNTIQSIDVRDNTLRSVDVRNSSLKGIDIADGSLTNADVGIYYATVSSAAAVIDQSGGVTANKLGSGEYEVDFHRNITKCAFSATVGDPEDNSQAGQIDVADRDGNVNAVWLRTRPSDGSAPADRSFHLIVVC